MATGPGHQGLGEVAALAGLPLVVHVDENGASEVDDGGPVRKDADDATAPL
jgi:hypothetical protein